MPAELDRLVDLYDGGVINRRQLVVGLLALGLGAGVARPASTNQPQAPLLRARTMNHVTLYAKDVTRSKAFYQRVAGLPIREEAKDFCEFKLDNAFLGIYAAEAPARPGFDHFCFGIQSYDAKRTHALHAASLPEGRPTIENDEQVYVRDPDGVRVQFADVGYKR